MSFNMDDYVDVAERIRLAKETWPEMSFQPANPLKPFDIVEVNGLTFVVYCAALYRDPADSTPAMGIAWEQVPGSTPYTRGSELMNAETSAWGRAVIAAGIPSKKIASKDEIRARKPEPNVIRLDAKQAKAEGLSAWDIGRLAVESTSGVFAPPDDEHQDRNIPECEHGFMKEKKGVSDKTGKDYFGYTCTAPREEQCPAQWWVIGADGHWHPKVAK